MKFRKLVFCVLAFIMVLMVPIGAMAAPKQGWSTDQTGKWSYYTNNSWVKNAWLRTGDTWYLFDKQGYMLTGWQNVSGTWYYLKPSGAMATGWLKLGSTWYYLKSSGAMATGWIQSGGKWYYMSGSGAMLASQWVGNDYVGSSGAWEPGKSRDDNQQSSEVWLSETGSKYHSINNCGNMNPKKATKTTLSNAKKQGYKPCNVCNPPQ